MSEVCEISKAKKKERFISKKSVMTLVT